MHPMGFLWGKDSVSLVPVDAEGGWLLLRAGFTSSYQNGIQSIVDSAVTS